MREITQFANRPVEIRRRRRQRWMFLTVRDDGSLRVTCNFQRTAREILSFIEENRAFVLRRSLEIEALRKACPAKTAMSGDRYLFLGERRLLEVVWSWGDEIRVEAPAGGPIEMVAPLASTVEDRLAALHEHFVGEGRQVLLDRVELWSDRMAVYPLNVHVRGQRTRWGSCSRRRTISLNWKIVAAPMEVVDYVVVHELAHLKEMNHSSRFWSIVASHLPDYKTHVKWLRAHEKEILLQFQHGT